MELQALLVLGGVGVALVAVVLLMGLFSTSGTSYEEAIAQQRRATTELLALDDNKNKPKKKEKKANKKLAKKEKKEAVAATTSEPEPEAESETHGESGVEEEPAKPHVEFSPPVVVDVRRDSPPNVKIRKRGKDPKVKPILVNKEDPSCVSDLATPSPPPLNHFEESQPKDEFELLHASLAAVGEKAHEKKQEEPVEKKETGKGKGAKGAKGGAKQTPPAAAPAPEPVKEEAVRERHNSGEDKPKEQRSNKGKKLEKKSISEDSVDSPREEVVPPLNAPQPSELTTDKLLRQVASSASASASSASPSAGKNKKKKNEHSVRSLMAAGDGGVVDVLELVRVVRQAVLSHDEIQTLTDTLLNKQQEPLPHHSEWTEGPNDPMQKLKKQLAEVTQALEDEKANSQNLLTKFKEHSNTISLERTRAREQAVLAAETAAAAAAAKRASEQQEAALRAELHTLQTRQQRLIEENKALGEVQAQRVQLEMHIQRLSESEAALVQQLQALQAEVSARAVEAGQARCEAGAARDSAMMAQQHVSELAAQLQEATHAYQELDSRMQQLTVSEQRAQAELRAAQERLNSMSDAQGDAQRANARAAAAEASLDKLKEQADKHKQDADKLKQEADKLKREIEQHKLETEKHKQEVEKQKQEADKWKQEAERQKQQLTSEIESLKEQLSLREAELAEIKQMKVPAQNGLPPTSEQHKAAELAKVESVVEALKTELEGAKKSSSEQREQLARLQEQLGHYQTKNNDLRTKNWKVMAALQSAEKALQSRGPAMPAQDHSLREAITKAQEAQYNEVANVLRTACPSVSPSSAADKDWLQAFADNLRKELEKREAEKKQVDKVLETEKARVDQYKKIIEETQGTLSRLQQTVTMEEASWAQKLVDKQKQLDELKQRTLSQMQTKIDALQAELQQTKLANHNHSFADAERLTEERLMVAGLSNKQSADLSNGPLQMEHEK